MQIDKKIYIGVELIPKWQNVNTLIPHLGGLVCLYGLFSPIRKLIKNAYFITSVSATMKMVKFASEVNPDNLLFGTDFPFNNCFNQKFPLEEMYNMKISDDVKNNILGRKAFKLFGFDKI